MTCIGASYPVKQLFEGFYEKEIRMATRKIMIAAMTVIVTIAFGVFGQKAFGKEDPNMAAEKVKKVDKSSKVEHRLTGERVKQRMAELGEKLNLTEEQKKAIRPIVEKEIKELGAVKNDASLSKEQKLEKMKTIRQTSQEDMKKILTPEQQVKLAEVKEETKQAAKEDITQVVQKRMMAMNERLGLTDEQRKTIGTIIEKELKETVALKNDETLSKEQKLEKIKTIRQTSREEIKKVLTPEQQTKFEEQKEKPRIRRIEQKSAGKQ